MAKAPQLTASTMKVVEALLANAGASGADIAKVTRLPSGTLYPILLRLEGAGWLVSEWEAGEPSSLGRPRKRFYRVTAEGVRAVRSASRELHAVSGRLAWG
jgi:PadR family transcriptional regulator PadR